MGGLWLSSQGCYVNENVQEFSLEPAMGLYIEPPSNRAVILLHWAKRALTGRSGHTDRTLALSVRSSDGRHASPASNDVRHISTATKLTGRSGKTDRTLKPQRLVVSSKLPEAYFFDWTRPVHLDRTQTSVRCSTLSTVPSDSSIGHSLSASGR